MKNACSPQANSVYHQLSPKTHGMEEYPAKQHKSGAFSSTVYVDISKSREMLAFFSVTAITLLI